MPVTSAANTVAARQTSIMVGVALLVLAPLFPALVWGYGRIAPTNYTATAVFNFYPGHPINAEQGLLATWQLLPQDEGVSLEMVEGEPHLYKLSAVQPHPESAAIIVNAYLDQAEAKSHRSGGLATFRVINRAMASAGARPALGSVYLIALWFSLYHVLFGRLLLAKRQDSAQTSRVSVA